MKLYAGYISGNYEYAVWVKNKAELSTLIYRLPFCTEGGFLDQSENNNLKPLIEYKDLIYRTPLDTDEPNWQPFKNK